MAVIWGFDLSEMSWSAFGHKKMFDRRWHLRRERFIIYQLAMLICLAAECTATYSLTKYEKLQGHVENDAFPKAHLYNNDLIDAEIVTIVFCVLVATIFGTDFFFLLFFPRRTYPRWYNIARKALAVIISLGLLAATILSTIVVASHSAYITRVPASVAQQYTHLFSRPPLKHRLWPTNTAYVVLLWLGLISTIASTIVMFMAVKHDERYGAGPENGEMEKRPVV